jgi:beta-galactosidase
MHRQTFDESWFFRLVDPTLGFWQDPALTPERTVDLPHDWSVEFERDPSHPSGALGGFFRTGMGEYRKTFSAPEAWHGKKAFIEFEGVYMNAELWLNGHFLGRHPYGYTSFAFDLTPYLDYGGENALLVVVNNACQLNSRWYSGSGIYRHVWLMVAGLVHVDHWGVYVTTPVVTQREATIRVRTTLLNESGASADVVLTSSVVAPDSAPVAESATSAIIASYAQVEVSQDIPVPNPQHWSPDTPDLYLLETQVTMGGQVVDSLTTPFGIRSLQVDAEHGFLLNGEPLLLKGGCVHHDNGVMGAASYDRSEERKVELLKASGYNAVRCAHNPPAPAFLDACDRLGLLVIDEAFDMWRAPKTTNDYHVYFDDWWRRDLESMVRRDRNHPSVVMWSVGNELVERGLPEGVEIARTLADQIRNLDPTRPITAAINGLRDKGLGPWADDLFAVLDVCGYNYKEDVYRVDHERVPERVIYGSESMSAEAFEHWMSVEALDYVIGDFVWTSLDYLGESGIGRVVPEGESYPFLPDYPWHQANCGDLDLCGFKRPQSYYRDVLWGHGNPLYIAVHPPEPEGKTWTITRWGWPDVWPNWTWPGHEGEILKVDVYSACEQVALFLNERPLDRAPTTQREKHTATFEVPYERGTLKARGYTGGQQVAELEIKTVDAPAAIRLTPDRITCTARPGDLVFVTVEVVDLEGLVYPTAEHLIRFAVQGAGNIAAVGNGNPRSTEMYRGSQRQAFRGRCLVVLRSNGESGEIVLQARADGLEGQEITVRAV